MTRATDPPSERSRLLGWWSGGWVLALAAVLVTLAVGWRVSSMLRGRGSHAIGDGVHVESYGFALEPLLVPPETLAPAGPPREGIPALVDPPAMDVGRAERPNEFFRGKFLVSTDRVIGVCLAGACRAYPLSILAWHEVANDTLGGVPIAVTYSPVADAAVVFDRRVAGDEPAEFGVSGLLYNSSLLAHDRRGSGTRTGVASLWSPLLGRAVAGPAAAERRRLAILPSVVTLWSDWRDAHPDTSVLAPDPARSKRYRQKPYATYFGSDDLRYPVSPRPPAGIARNKTPVVAVLAGGSWYAWRVEDLIARAGDRHEIDLEAGGVSLRARLFRRPLAARLEAEDAAPLPAIHAAWFAWYATHGPTVLDSPAAGPITP